MTVSPVGTFCYRVLIDIEHGETLGNMVFVGLEIQHPYERARLMFSGLPKRVELIREALEDARVDGHLFETSGTTNARELALAMRRLSRFHPVLVVGEEIHRNILLEPADSITKK